VSADVSHVSVSHGKVLLGVDWWPRPHRNVPMPYDFFIEAMPNSGITFQSDITEETSNPDASAYKRPPLANSCVLP
jgi:hypothetical protein